MPSTRCRERLRRRARLLSCSTFSYLRVELSRLGAQLAGDRGPVKKWGWGAMTPSASGWLVQSETHQIRASTMWISRGLNAPALVMLREGGASSNRRFRRFPLNPKPNCRRLLDRPPARTMTVTPPSPRQNPSAPCASYPARTR